MILRKGRPYNISYAPSPHDITIEIDAAAATSRKNSDGNYYTITFPDDFIGTRGTSDDLFKDARIGTGPISLPVILDPPTNGYGYGMSSQKLNVILNIPAGMRLGANTANHIIPPLETSLGNYNKTDPALYFKFNTSDWTQDVLTRLNLTVNNHGVLFGGGGSGGWGGMVTTNVKNQPDQHPARGGAGSGQGLHQDHGVTTLGDYYDPDDTTFPAGQAGSGYKWWGTASLFPAANGTHGTTEEGGFGSPGVTDSGLTSDDDTHGGLGHYGGSVIYYESDVASPTTGTHITLYNKGWMSAGCGGGSGRQIASGVSGHGGDWDVAIYGDDHWRGAGGLGSRAPSIFAVAGGFPGQLFEKAAGTQLSISNTVTNHSGNTIYGWNEIWQPE
jgi:hypothetical protein